MHVNELTLQVPYSTSASTVGTKRAHLYGGLFPEFLFDRREDPVLKQLKLQAQETSIKMHASMLTSIDALELVRKNVRLLQARHDVVRQRGAGGRPGMRSMPLSRAAATTWPLRRGRTPPPPPPPPPLRPPPPDTRPSAPTAFSARMAQLSSCAYCESACAQHERSCVGVLACVRTYMHGV